MILKSYRIYGKNGGMFEIRELGREEEQVTFIIQNGDNSVGIVIEKEQFREIADLLFKMNWSNKDNY